MIVFLSALGEVSEKVAGLKLGAVDYITKPIQAEEVLARVATHLTRQYLERELRRSRDRLDRELANAADMQRQLLPRDMPDHPGVDFAAFYQTSRHAGGDYYDVIPIGPHQFGVIVADVSGHGAPAAIVMAMIRAVLHTFPGSPVHPPAVTNHINRHFQFLWDTAMFATAVYGALDVQRRTWRSTCAGHPPPLLVRAGQGAAPLPSERTQTSAVQRPGGGGLQRAGAEAGRSHRALHRRHHRSVGAGRHAVRGGRADRGARSRWPVRAGVDRRAADDRSRGVRRRAGARR